MVVKLVSPSIVEAEKLPETGEIPATFWPSTDKIPEKFRQEVKEENKVKIPKEGKVLSHGGARAAMGDSAGSTWAVSWDLKNVKVLKEGNEELENVAESENKVEVPGVAKTERNARVEKHQTNENKMEVPG